MIQIIDDWYITIETNPTNYVVRRGSGRDSDGKVVDRARGYFGGAGSAIKFIREQIIAETLKEGVRSLDEALCVMREIDERFVKILEEATHEDIGRV